MYWDDDLTYGEEIIAKANYNDQFDLKLPSEISNYKLLNTSQEFWGGT